MAQTIFITGRSGGFGRLMSEMLAHQGYTVFVGVHTTDKNAPAAGVLCGLAT